MNTFSRVHDFLHPTLSLGSCIVHPSGGQLSHARATIKDFGTSICIWVGFTIQTAIIAFCLTSDQRLQQSSWISCNEVMAICWGTAPVLKLPSLLTKEIILKLNWSWIENKPTRVKKNNPRFKDIKDVIWRQSACLWTSWGSSASVRQRAHYWCQSCFPVVCDLSHNWE